MAGFSDGLMAGFQFVEGIADRRERRRLADEELGLRRAANDRAEAAFTTQQGIIADTQLRQQKTDRAASVFARVQAVGIENAQPHELAELQELAAYNPEIAASLGEMRAGQRDVDAIQALGGARRGGSSVAPAGLSAAAQMTAPTPQGAGVSPAAFVSPDGSELPESQIQGRVGAAADVAGREGVKTVSAREFKRLYPGVDPATLGDAYRQSPAMDGGFFDSIDLPAEFKTEEELASMNIIERQAVVDRQRAMLGDGNFSAVQAANRQRTAAARDVVDSYRGFIKPDDETGADLRRMAAEDPLSATLELAKNYRTLEAVDPNTLSIVSREMAPVTERARQMLTERLRALPVGPDGTVPINAETRALRRDYNQVLAVRQQLSDEWKTEIQDHIRGEAMPIGNAQLGEAVASFVAGTAPPAMPATAAEFQANMTMARRAVNSVADGGRNISKRQAQALAWATKRGIISQEGLQQFLSTGTFEKPADAKMFDHDPKKQLWVNGQMVYSPPAEKPTPGEVSGWAPEQQEVIHGIFAAPPGSTPEQVARAAEQENAFYIAANRHADDLWGGSGFNVDDYRQLDRAGIAYLTNRFLATQKTMSEYDNDTFLLLPKRWIRGTAEDNGINVTNSDELARQYGVTMPPLPVRKANLDAARMQLDASPDPVDQVRARLPDDQLARLIMEETRAAGAPPRSAVEPE